MRTSGFVFALALAVSGVAPVAAQQTIRGRVVDESARPLAGVTILAGTKSTTSGINGRFVFADVQPGTIELRARRLGFAPLSQKVEVAPGQTVDLELKLTTQEVTLAELVTTGYGETQAGNVTGAVTQVTTEEFNGGRVVNATELVQNKVAGVQVAENNEPGGGISIRIRGQTSVNASSEPLYVIDGLPISTGSGTGVSAGREALNFLNPNDIESITILRDASAASIYGANAANGVVLITTKGGRRAPSFEYSATVSGSQVTRVPSVLNATQFAAAVAQYAPTKVSQLGGQNTDWYNLITRSSFGQEHNAAIAGATDKMDYRFSFNFLNQDGIVIGSNVQRLGAGINLNQRLFDDRLSVRFNLRGSRTVDQFTPGGVISNATQFGPTQPVNDATAATGFYNWPGNALTSADNPLEIAALAIDQGTTTRGVGNVQAKYSVPFIDGLSVNMNTGFDVTKFDRRIFTPSALHSQTKTGNGGNVTFNNGSQVNVVSEFFLNYLSPSKVGPGTVDLTGGYSFSRSSAEYPTISATGLSTDALGIGGIPTAKTIQTPYNVQESKLISFFGRFNYNIDDKYLLSASIRRDGSSRFGPANAYGVFPSVAVAWRLSQEGFLKDLKGLSDLKLRGAIARTGNQAFANYQQFSTYTVGDAQSQYFFNGQFVSTIRPSAVDPNIKWESTRSINVGLDFGLWNQRVTGSIDYYDKQTSDLIFTVPVAAGTNLSNFVTTNIGTMSNKGVEVGLSMKVLQGGKDGLNWQADFTAARNDNMLVSINPSAGGTQQILTGGVSGGVGTTIQVLTPGVPVNSFFVLQQRYDASGKPIYNAAGDTAMYVDQNKDGKITVDDRVATQSPQPKWIFGHSSYITYGKFDLSFTLRAYTGNYVYNNVASSQGYYNSLTSSSPYNLHTSVLATSFIQPQFLSDYYLESASFLRMDQATIGYSFDLGRKPARFFVTAQNVFTITGYTGVDPTAGVNGIDNNIYPRSRTFTGGLSFRL